MSSLILRNNTLLIWVGVPGVTMPAVDPITSKMKVHHQLACTEWSSPMIKYLHILLLIMEKKKIYKNDLVLL